MAGNRGPADGFQEENVVRLSLAAPLEPRSGALFQGASSFQDLFFIKDAALFNGYVDIADGDRRVCVKRPGRELFRAQGLGVPTTPLMGMYFYPGRGLSKGIRAVVYNSTLTIFIDAPFGGAPSFTHTGIFPSGNTIGTAGGEVEPVYFEGVPLPDLGRKLSLGSTESHSTPSSTTASPPLEGFFITGPFDSYFYNSRSNTLTKITSPNYPYRVVGGAAWLNGRFYVMTPEGRIYASGINDPYTWSALDFINAIMHPDKGSGVWRRHTYLMAMGQSSTEWFYDSGAATGNPLRRVDSAAHDFGCLHSGSVVNLRDQTILVGFTEKPREKGVFVLEGYVPKKVSTPFVDRIINHADQDCVWAFPLFHNGHRFYILNACCFGLSLVYDMDTNLWFIWDSRNTVARSVTSLTSAVDTAVGLVEVTAVVSPSASALTVGTPITIAGATPSSYNGDFTVHRVLTSTSFTYILPLSAAITSPATGTITARIYFQNLVDSWTLASLISEPTGSFPSTSNLVLDRTTGDIYQITEDAQRDNVGVANDVSFIDFTMRLARWDQSNNMVKFISRVEGIGDKASNKFVVRYSDDDYQSWSPYRVLDMNLARASLPRQGSTRRRAYEVRHPFDGAIGEGASSFDAMTVRIESLELFTKQGSNV